ncbi:MAG: tetratricopeptide repeat protein [Chloroflexi bacterium]|nr:tetratricopeptide repeat protein [Chloroflexota bacterium]
MPNCAGCTVDRLLGLLSQTMGNLDQAASHFGDALTFCRKAGYRPELAWTCCDYADALRERDGDGDRAKAMSLLDESLAISGELGMRPLMERVLSRREILSAQLALARGTAVRAAKTKVGQSPVVQVPLSLQQMKAKRILDELKFSRSLGLRLQEAIAN